LQTSSNCSAGQLPLPSSARVGALGVVLGIHALALWAVSATSPPRPARIEQSLHAVLVLTNNPVRQSEDLAPLVRDTVVLQDPIDPASSLPTLPVIQFAEPNGGAVRVAPQLLDKTPPPIAPFARQAGLLSGESATVVLRLEVLRDGSVGRVDVDVSSGSAQVDEAARAYARLLLWVPGRYQDEEQVTWVRYGVRLAA